jgi:hypothetical protein
MVEGEGDLHLSWDYIHPFLSTSLAVATAVTAGSVRYCRDSGELKMDDTSHGWEVDFHRQYRPL